MYLNKLNYRLLRCIPSFQNGFQSRNRSCDCKCCGADNFVKDKVAIVTGGATGIGLECAKELLKNGLKGIVIGDQCGEEECMATLTKDFSCCKIIFKECDVTNRCQFMELFQAAMKKWNSVDILLNNAGILNDSEWEREIAINVTALVRGTFMGLEYMGKDKGGCGGAIVNFASILGLQHSAGSPVYVGTKHFVVGFDRSIGDCYHYKRTGVKILTMCPGVTLTPMIHNAGKVANTELEPDLGKLLTKDLASLPPQQPDAVAKALILMLNKGESGSIWVSEGNEFFQVRIPSRHTFRVCECTDKNC